jgi:Mg2+ and Co2+ transporter CorA
MRSIAIVGLIYLPATFVSGIFGTNFFQFSTDKEDQGWRVSEEFWLYWAVTVPLTLGTVVLWTCAFHLDGIQKIVGWGWRQENKEEALERA